MVKLKDFLFDRLLLGIFCRIGAETTTGCLFAANAFGQRGKSSSDVEIQVTEELMKDLSYKACMDRYLEDQESDFIC